MKPTSLTPRQRRFVGEYLVDLCGTRAAIRAGYTPTHAEVVASRLLKRPQVAAAVRTAMRERAERTELTADRVVLELRLLAFSDVTHYVVADDGRLTVRPDVDPGVLRAVASYRRRERGGGDGREVEAEVRLWSKLEALKLLAMHLGILKPAALPPLDAVLSALPGEVADQLRPHLMLRLIDNPPGEAGDLNKP